MLIIFPVMYPDLLSRPAPAGSLFLDSGYEDAPRPGAWRPEGLPLAPKAARQLVAEAVGFGEQFRHPGEMASYGLAPERRDPESSSAIRGELLARVQGQAAPNPEDPARAQAQFVLLLAWFQQQRRAEAETLRRGAADARARLERSLTGASAGEPDVSAGSDAPEAEALAIDAAMAHFDRPQPEDDPLPWAGILTAAARFLPAGAQLWVVEPDAVAAFVAAGAAFAPLAADAAAGLPAGTRRAEAPLWRLLGRSAPGTDPVQTRSLVLLTDLSAPAGA
ncbi:MAG: hypothetical protein AB7D57_07970, partial [Desulfovibrionaceae bacterium]